MGVFDVICYDRASNVSSFYFRKSVPLSGVSLKGHELPTKTTTNGVLVIWPD